MRLGSGTARRAVIVAIAAAVIAGGALAAVQRLTARHNGIHYVTRAVAYADISATVSETGTVNPVDVVAVGSQVSGQVKALYADFNSKVKKGQLIAEIDPQSFQARVDQAPFERDDARGPRRQP